MLQQAEPDDYVVATGETHSVREFVELAFAHVGLRLAGSTCASTRRCYRPAEVDLLIGDPAKAQRGARLAAARVSSEELVAMMVDADLEAEERNRHRQVLTRSARQRLRKTQRRPITR